MTVLSGPAMRPLTGDARVRHAPVRATSLPSMPPRASTWATEQLRLEGWRAEVDAAAEHRCDTPWCTTPVPAANTHCAHHVAMEAGRG